MKMIKQTFYLSLIICLSVFLTSCSTLSEFMIINKSGSVIEIEYKVKNIANYEKPRITSAEKTTGMSKGWQQIEKDNLEIDEATRTIKIKLPSGKAVIVAAEVNYSGHDKDEINIESIKIMSGGSMDYVGKQAQRAFKKQENSDYSIIYE